MKNGEKWYDSAGNVIHAHGGDMLCHEGVYYWYGEDRRGESYVSCYCSRNLRDWEFAGHSLTVKSRCEGLDASADLSLYHDINGKRVKVNLERPKVLYHKRTKRFVMWAHYENGTDYLDARCAVASCDTPYGEFTYHGSFRPLGYFSRDCTLYDDGACVYFISTSRDNADLHIYRISENYLRIEEHVKTLWKEEYREAPALFRHENRYYMLTSHCTGWAPNQGKYAWADSITGEWSQLENFGDETTFGSQPAFVLPALTAAGREKLYYFADRWGGSNNYFHSTYVVLEIKFDPNGMPYLEYQEEYPCGISE